MPQYTLSTKETAFANVAPHNGTALDPQYALSSQYIQPSVNGITPFVGQCTTQYPAASEQAASLFRNWYQQPLYLPPRRPETFPTQWFIPPPPGATFLFAGASQAFSIGCQPQQHSHNAGSFGPQQQNKQRAFGPIRTSTKEARGPYERPRVDYGAGPLVMLSVVQVPPGKN
ncbi:hypothetical protein CPB85DRAFT_871446 [Mucidula mucida]|nr:hypothetical protein CPB85DRAFT_871446 [Mucidula mucida]